jgi:hypothetical protein
VHVLADGAYGPAQKVQAGETLRIDAPFPFDIDPAELLDPDNAW